MGTVKSMQALLACFFDTAADDPRVRAVHISLYLALLNEWQVQAFASPVCIRRDVVMRAAKIKARHTYNTVINELREYGYIRYLPSADPRVPSEAWFE
jgi:hypothetical protein